MARLKTPEELVRTKRALAERLTALRSELHGDRGRPALARRLGIPARTWYNYEMGCTVPGEIILKLIKLTLVEAEWLLDGKGPKFRVARAEPDETRSQHEIDVGTLLRTALHLLENSEPTSPRREVVPSASESAHGRLAAIGVSPLSPDLIMVRHGQWSERSSDLGRSARPGRREA